MDSDCGITEEIVLKSLAREFSVEPNQIQLKSVEISDGSKKGENFSCVMKLVTAVANVPGNKDHQTYYYMVKAFPTSQFRVDILKKVKLQTKRDFQTLKHYIHSYITRLIIDFKFLFLYI